MQYRRPSRILCPLCSTYNSGWIHFIFTHQATSAGVLRVKFLAKFQNLIFWQFFRICNFDFVLFWPGICESLVWVIMGWLGVSQEAGILVILVGTWDMCLWFLTHRPMGSLNEILDMVIDSWGISCDIALIWISLDFTDDQSILVQLMAWCCQATNHYLSQCWPRSLLPYGVTRPVSFKCKNFKNILVKDIWSTVKSLI